MIEIELANRQEQLRVPESEICEFVRQLLQAEGVPSGSISLAVVGDCEMRGLHRQFLGDDTTTDVLSFPLDEYRGNYLDGEVVVNAQQAVREAARIGCEPLDEILLYFVHGVLHLCGYDDRTEQDAALMRDRQAVLLAGWGVSPTGKTGAINPPRKPTC